MADRLSFAVGPRTGTAPTQPVTAFNAASVKMNLATGPEVTFSIPGRSPAALAVSGLATDVWTYRNGTLLARTRVMPVAQTWGADGEDVAALTSVGYKRIVGARNIVSGPPTYTATDQGAILWGLIGHTQAQPGGSLGITAGAYTTGVLRDRTSYQIGDNLGTLMGDMGNVVNGCWWGIDANRVFSAKLWSAFDTRTDPIVKGVNARTMQRTPGPPFANAAGAVGSRTDTTPVWVAAGDVATDPRGRWEAFDSSHGSVTVQATVTEHANGLLASRAHPPSQWVISLEPAAYFEGSSDYAEGEFVRLVVPASAVDELGPPVDVLAQITEVSISVSDSGETAVALAATELGPA